MLLASINDFINFEDNKAFTIALIVIIALFIITMVALSVVKNKKNKSNSSSNDLEQENVEGTSDIDFQDDSNLIIDKLDWESDQAIFVLPEELMEKKSEYSEVPENDLFAKVSGYSLRELAEDGNYSNRGPIREYEPIQESDTISIIMTPVKAQHKKKTKKEQTSSPERLESSFASDYIYDPITATQEGLIVMIKDSKDKYRFRFKASDGVTVGYSQGYDKKMTAKDVIKEITIIAESAEISDHTMPDKLPVMGRPIFEIYKDLEDKFRYKLMSASGRVLLASQGFYKKNNCIAAVQAIRDIVKLHHFVDLPKPKDALEEQPFIEQIPKTEN